MKKIFLMGRSEAGKTSLTQALKGEELHYIKTQYTNSNDDTIDSPGEYAESKRFSVGLACFSFEADVKFSGDPRSFGVRILESEEKAQAYQFLFHVKENRYVFEKNPNWPWFGCMNIGLERPIDLNAGETYHIQIIFDDDIATLYVNGVALNTRAYEKPGDSLSLFVTDGTLEVTNASIARGIKA